MTDRVVVSSWETGEVVVEWEEIGVLVDAVLIGYTMDEVRQMSPTAKKFLDREPPSSPGT